MIPEPKRGSLGGLAHARQSHTATLLRNGQVLVVGGYNRTSLSSAELYDPRTRSWTATGSMSVSRNVPTATLLPNGEVLVAGGYSYTSGFLRSAELYDPATGAMGCDRQHGHRTGQSHGHAVVLKEGAGGRGTLSGILPTRARAEIYDLVSGTWRMAGRLQIGRAKIIRRRSCPSGEVIVAGGQNPGEGSNNQILSEAELFGQP